MIRKLSSAIFLWLIMFYNGGLGVRAQVSLQQAIQTMLERNMQIRQAQFGYDISEQNLIQSKKELYPSVSFGADNTNIYGLTFDQTSGQLIQGDAWTSYANAQVISNVEIFRGFQKVNQIRANKIQLAIDASEVDKVKNDLTLSVITNYLEAITNNELYEAAKQQVRLSSEQLRQDSIQFAVGNKTIADISQSENQVATDELSIMTSENAYELSMLNLKQLMEMSPDTTFELEKPDIAEIMAEYAVLSFDDVFQKALTTQPNIEQAGYNIALAKKNIDIAKGGYYPTLSLSGSYGTNYSSRAMTAGELPGTFVLRPFFDQVDANKSFRGGIGLTVPIFNNGRIKADINRAKLSYLQAQTADAIERRNLERTIGQAILDLKFANKQYFTSQVAFNTSRVAFEAIKERYDVGMANSIEMFTAQTNMNRAEFDMIRRKYEMVFRGKVIDYYIGNPITF